MTGSQELTDEDRKYLKYHGEGMFDEKKNEEERIRSFELFKRKYGSLEKEKKDISDFKHYIPLYEGKP